MQAFSYLDFARSLSFGGLIGGCLAGIIYLRHPEFFQGNIGFKSFILAGALAGASTQRVIEGVVNFILFPIGRFASFYEKMVELDLLLFFNRITEEQHSTLLAKLTEQRFLGLSSDKLLPPKS